MERFLRYKEDNSDKYWEVVFAERTMQVFFGKVGSAGRVEVKEFDSPEEGTKEIEKLIKSKLKKGYVEVSESSRTVKDASTLSEIKDFEEQWGIKVSAISKKLMNESFFWNCTEETSPFGSDEGNDTFASYNESIADNPRLKAIDFLKEILSDTSLYPLTDLLLTESSGIASNVNESLYDYVIIQDNAIWAVAFGQLVMRGKMDEDIKEIVEASLKRQKLDLFLDLHGDEDRVEHIEKMEKVLNSL